MGRAVAVTPRVACLPRVAALLRVASLLHCCCAALVPKAPTPAAPSPKVPTPAVPSPKVPKPPHSGYHIRGRRDAFEGWYHRLSLPPDAGVPSVFIYSVFDPEERAAGGTWWRCSCSAWAWRRGCSRRQGQLLGGRAPPRPRAHDDGRAAPPASSQRPSNTSCGRLATDRDAAPGPPRGRERELVLHDRAQAGLGRRPARRSSLRRLARRAARVRAALPGETPNEPNLNRTRTEPNPTNPNQCSSRTVRCSCRTGWRQALPLSDDADFTDVPCYSGRTGAAAASQAMVLGTVQRPRPEP